MHGRKPATSNKQLTRDLHSLRETKASELIAYQAIITSASRQHPLHAWLNYDTQFCITAASDRTLRWDMRHSDLWFKCITPFATASQPGHFPCVHCGQTSHYPGNCVFRPSLAQSSNQQPGSRGTATELKLYEKSIAFIDWKTIILLQSPASWPYFPTKAYRLEHNSIKAPLSPIFNCRSKT